MEISIRQTMNILRLKTYYQFWFLFFNIITNLNNNKLRIRRL